MARSPAYDRRFFLFFSALIGRPVVDSEGRSVGRVRDLAVRIRDLYPPVTALVVSRRRGGRFAVPWDAVAECGVRTFRLRAGDVGLFGPPAFSAEEAPLREAVLDKQIVDMDGAKVERVNDLHLIRVDNNLRVAHVDIGVRGLIRRLGCERAIDALIAWLFSYRLADRFIPWKYVQLVPLAYSHGVQFNFPIQKLSELHPADLAEIVEDLSIHQSSRILTSLDVQTAAQALSEVDPEVQTSIIEAMDREQASDIIEEMPPEEAADLLGELREDVAEDVLEGFEEDHAEEVRELLAYDEDTAGGLMSPEFFCLPESLTVQGALDRIRQANPQAAALPYLYLVDARSCLVGVASLRELILGKPETPLAGVMERRIVSVRPDAGSREVMELLVKYSLRALPVVDEDGTIKGVIGLQEAFTAVFPEAEGE
jgi:magnesium transporter